MRSNPCKFWMAAKLAGEKKYSTGVPCKKGHMSERYTSSTRCCECALSHDRATYKEKYEKKIKPRRMLPEVRAENARKAAEYRDRLSEEKKAIAREKAKIRSREWRKNNPGHRNALKYMYIADRTLRTPEWANHARIIEFYKNCPPGHHVDHIIPLRAKNVSGLHVDYNLQYLPAKENMRKNNRFDPDAR